MSYNEPTLSLEEVVELVKKRDSLVQEVEDKCFNNKLLIDLIKKIQFKSDKIRGLDVTLSNYYDLDFEIRKIYIYNNQLHVMTYIDSEYIIYDKYIENPDLVIKELYESLEKLKKENEEMEIHRKEQRRLTFLKLKEEFEPEDRIKSNYDKS